MHEFSRQNFFGALTEITKNMKGEMDPVLEKAIEASKRGDLCEYKRSLEMHAGKVNALISHIDRQITCIHEAGHAVIAVEMGFQVKYAQVWEDPKVELEPILLDDNDNQEEKGELIINILIQSISGRQSVSKYLGICDEQHSKNDIQSENSMKRHWAEHTSSLREDEKIALLRGHSLPQAGNLVMSRDVFRSAELQSENLLDDAIITQNVNVVADYLLKYGHISGDNLLKLIR